MIIFGRQIRNRYLVIGDILLTLASVLVSYFLRLELIAIFPTYQNSLLWMMGIAVIIKPLVYYFFGIYRRLWRYASTRELVLIMSAVTVASMILSIGMMVVFISRVFGFKICFHHRLAFHGFYRRDPLSFSLDCGSIFILRRRQSQPYSSQEVGTGHRCRGCRRHGGS